MLLPAALHVTDRLIATLMTLVRAVAAVAHASDTPTAPRCAAQDLFFRLSDLVTAVIRIGLVGFRARPASTTPAPAPLRARALRPNPAPRRPNRRGWLLAILPDIAPAIAADLRTLLADPACIAFLRDAPTVHRTLRPLLRALGLTPPRPDPSRPDPPRSDSPRPDRPAPDPPQPSPPPRPAHPVAPSGPVEPNSPGPRLRTLIPFQ